MFRRRILSATYLLGLGLTVLPQITSAQIVNIENNRLEDNAKGWVGAIDFGFYTLKSQNTLVRFNNTTRVQYAVARSKFLLLNDANFIFSGTENFERNYFQHFRYNLFVDSNLTLEAFVQNQFDRVMQIERRFLLGAGPRFQFVDGKRFKLNIGLLYMYEFEKELDSPVKRFDHRLSSYIAFKVILKDYLSLLNTTYFQPNLNFWPDHRISSNSSLRIKVNHHFSVFSSFNLAYDTFPIENKDVPKLIYRFNSGFSINLRKKKSPKQ